MDKSAGLTVTVSEVNDLVVSLCNTACRILHERSPRLTVAMVRAVVERRMATEYPTAAALLRRLPKPTRVGKKAAT